MKEAAKSLEGDEKTGAEIVGKALVAPLRSIVNQFLCDVNLKNELAAFFRTSLKKET